MKKLILILTVLCVATVSEARHNNNGVVADGKTNITIKDTRKSVVKIGLKAGMNFSTMSSYDVVDLGLKSGSSFEGGAFVSARFGKRTKASDAGTGLFGAQIELLYIQNSIKNDYADNIKLNYFAAPVMAKLFFLPGFNVEAGVTIAGVLSSSPDMIETNLNQPWPGIEKATIATGDFKGFDVRPAVGLAYTLPSAGLGINARYYFGTSELAKNFPCKVNSLEIALSYSFNLFKF